MSTRRSDLRSRLKGLTNSIATRIPQLELRWLGGIKTIAGRLTFYRGMLTFLMIIPAAWNTSPLIRSMFGTIWVFVAFLFGCLAIAAVAEYAVIFPSQIVFNKSHSAKNDRDPIYEQARRSRETSEEILTRIEALERQLEDVDDE